MSFLNVVTLELDSNYLSRPFMLITRSTIRGTSEHVAYSFHRPPLT